MFKKSQKKSYNKFFIWFPKLSDSIVKPYIQDFIVAIQYFYKIDRYTSKVVASTDQLYMEAIAT
jgi:hypothetical protein